MELFDEDLVTLPEHLPEWFIDQRRMMVQSLASAIFCLHSSFCISKEEMPNMMTS